jgi:glyoxylase-like metal-dependent hydrolase (beta-lactamase superfamily II)
LDDGQKIVKGVKMVLSPGHTAEHASIIIESKLDGVKARIAVAGDTVISFSYFQMGHIWRYNADFFDADEVKKSISRLVLTSDVIIPGHSAPFLVYRPDWLKIEMGE